MSNHIQDWLTHVDNKEDNEYLRIPLTNVNMRLFRVNESYRKIILACCDHISHIALAGFEGYKLPHGTSAANAGIAFNIISIVKNRGLPSAYTWTMLNPEITRRWGRRIETSSNCGSIRLAEPIIVKRDEFIEFNWFDQKGFAQISVADPDTGSFTIQHEVDHNNGILIIDRVA